MTVLEERKQVIDLLNESISSGARQSQACEVLGLSERTLQRWQTGDTVLCDQRALRHYQPPHKLTKAERAEVLTVANSPEFGHLPPSQIVPRLADQGVKNHAKLSQVLGKTSLKTEPPRLLNDRHFAGETWGVKHESYSRNKTASFSKRREYPCLSERV